MTERWPDGTTVEVLDQTADRVRARWTWPDGTGITAWMSRRLWERRERRSP